MGAFKKLQVISDDGNYELEAVSGWLRIKTKSVTKQHQLFDYADKGTEECTHSGKVTRIVKYFEWYHGMYPVELIFRATYPTFFTNEDGKTSFISGYMSIANSINFAVEMSDDGSAVRLFKERRLD